MNVHGTIFYRSPEKEASAALDIFALGLIVFELKFKFLPFFSSFVADHYTKQMYSVDILNMPEESAEERKTENYKEIYEIMRNTPLGMIEYDIFIQAIMDKFEKEYKLNEKFDIFQYTDFMQGKSLREFKYGLELICEEEGVSKELMDFLEVSLQKEKSYRWKAVELLNHPFVDPFIILSQDIKSAILKFDG